MPRTMSAVEFKELGKRYYKQKEYQKAVDAFTEGLEVSGNSEISLLDNRAAAYEKLELYTNSLQDGRKMIQRQKQDVSGYLRTARALQKMGKSDKALEIFNYGLRNVPLHDTSYSVLRQMHDKLNKTLSPPETADPLMALPLEVVEMILCYLTFRNLVNCIRVSKQWKQFICSQSRLWAVLDLSHARGNVPSKFIRSFLDRSQGKITNAIIHRLYDNSVLRNFATKSRFLEKLEILSLGGNQAGSTLLALATRAPQLHTIKLHSSVKVTLDMISQMFRHCKSLVNAEFYAIQPVRFEADWNQDFPNLKTITFSSESLQSSTLLRLAQFLRRTPNLESLTLSRWTETQDLDYSTFPHLISLQLENCSLPVFPKLPSSLRILRFRGTRFTAFSIGPDHEQNALESSLPQLVELEVSAPGSMALESQFFKNILLLDAQGQSVQLQRYSSLERFSISGAEIDSRDELRQILLMPRIRGAIELDLSGADVEDGFAKEIPTIYPQLKHLNISMTKVTGVAVKYLIETLEPRLRWLGVNHCLSISPDAIKWARAKGVDVSFRTGEFTRGGKRVRT